MSDDDADSKTEEPTEKKLLDAFERGDTPMSREVPILASLTAMLIGLALVLPARTEPLAATLAHFIDDPAGWRVERGDDARALIASWPPPARTFLGRSSPC